MQTTEHRQFMLVPAILLILLATLSGRGMATGANGPVSRNRRLETAVADRLIAQGLGRQNHIVIPDPENHSFLPGSTPDNRYQYQWAQSAQDRRLQQRIASQVQDTIPGGRDLRVLVQNGHAFLYGRVRNPQERERAVEITQNTPGIERVRNQLTVAAQGWRKRGDSQIQEAIRDALRWSPFVDASQIEVDVNEGIATLSGTVDSFGGLIVAVESAFEGGARTVHDQLQIVRPDGRFGTDGATGRPFNTGMGRSR